MDFKTLIENMNPDIYQNLKTAIELGKWSNGILLTDLQKEHSMQALIAYEIENDFPEDQRIGYIDTSKKQKTTCNSDKAKPAEHEHEHEPVKWKH